MSWHGSHIALRTVAGVVVFAFFAACTTDPYTGEQQLSRTAIGAMIGSAAGAGVGALAGGAVGGYMDYQEAKLRERLRGTGVSVTRVGDEIVPNMPGNVTFDTDQDAIRSSFYDVLNSVVLVVQEYDKTIIEVTGHTDSTGSDAHNLDLSRRRAASVGAYLTSQGVNPQRVITDGFGEQYPVGDNATPQGRQGDRRVEPRLSPITA